MRRVCIESKVGFHQGTLPSVKRNVKNTLEPQKTSTPALAINLNSYKARQTQIEVPILKQQSTVFAIMGTRRDSFKTLEPPPIITSRPMQTQRH